VPPKKGQTPRKKDDRKGKGKGQKTATGATAAEAVAGSVEEDREEALMEEAKLLSQQLGIPIEEVPEMLAADCLNYTPPKALRERVGQEGNEGDLESDIKADKGSLFVKSTLECYVSAIVELYEEQVAQGTNNHPHPRGPGIKALLQSRDLERSKNDRESFKDRGNGVAGAGYTEKEFLQMQEFLLQTTPASPQVRVTSSHISGIILLYLLTTAI
jgi:hypothetical protein